LDENIKIFPQLEKVFRVYCMRFKELREKKQFPSHCVYREMKNVQNTKILFFGGGGRGWSIIHGFLLFEGVFGT
jgi:hypothetical protein